MANPFKELYRGFRDQFDYYGAELNSMLNPVLPYQRHAKIRRRLSDWDDDDSATMQSAGKSFGQSLLHLPIGMLNVLRGVLSIPRNLWDSFRDYSFVDFLKEIPASFLYGLGQTVGLVLKGAIQIVAAPLSLLFAVTTKPLASLVYRLFEYPITRRRVKKQGLLYEDVKALIRRANTPERDKEVKELLQKYSIQIAWHNPVPEYLELASYYKRPNITLRLLEVSHSVHLPSLINVFIMLTQADLSPTLQQGYRSVLIPKVVRFLQSRDSRSTLEQVGDKMFISSLGALYKSGLLPSMTDYHKEDFSQQSASAVGVGMLLGICESDSLEMNQQTESELWRLIRKSPNTRELLLREMKQKGEGWSGLDNLKAFMARASEDRSHEPTAEQYELINAIQAYGEQRPDAAASEAVSPDDPVVAQTKHSAPQVAPEKEGSDRVADKEELPTDDDEMVLDGKDMQTLIREANTPAREAKVSSLMKAEANKIDNQTLSQYLESSIENRRPKIVLGILELSWHRTPKQWTDIVEMVAQIHMTPELQQAYRAVLIPQIVVYLSAGRDKSRENVRVNGVFPAEYLAGLEWLVESGVLPSLTTYRATDPLPQQASTMATELLLGICESDSPAFDSDSHLSLWRLVSEHEDLREQFLATVQEKGAAWPGLSNLRAFVEKAGARDYSLYPVEQAEQTARKEFIDTLKAFGEPVSVTQKDTVSAVSAYRQRMHQSVQGEQGAQAAEGTYGLDDDTSPGRSKK